MTEQNGKNVKCTCSDFKTAANAQMKRVALGFGGAGSALFTLVSVLGVVSQLESKLGSGASLKTIAVAAVAGFIVGGGVGLLLGLPSRDGEEPPVPR